MTWKVPLYSSVLGLLLLLFACTSVAHAQFLSQETDGLSITITPLYPEPHTTITARAEGDGIMRSEIFWFANGVRLGEESKRTASVTLGGIGTETSIEAVRVAKDGQETRTNITVRPTEVDLLWSADSYTPPFFKGRSLPTPTTILKVEALARFKRPNGSFVPAKDLIYTWKMNNTVFGSVSGLGKKSAEIPPPPLFGVGVLSVEIETLDGTMRGRATTRVSSYDVTLVLYQDHPLFGVLRNTAIPDRVVFNDTEAVFAALPYYAKAQKATDKNLEYSWAVNNNSVQTDGEDVNKILIRTEGNSGLAHTELVLQNLTSVMQSARKTWEILFESVSRDSFFRQETP